MPNLQKQIRHRDNPWSGRWRGRRRRRMQAARESEGVSTPQMPNLQKQIRHRDNP
jgi:hypothetical protein